MNYSNPQIWFIIGVLAIGTYLIRFSFLGIIGDRPMPPLVLKLLRFTPVAVLPGMVAPLAIWPAATDGVFDAPRFLAATASLVVGYYTRSAIWAIFGGVGVLYAGLFVTGQF